MVNSKRRQRGITLLGWLFLLTPVAVVLYSAIRITPIYLNYMRVSKAIDDVAKEEGGESGNFKSIQVALSKRLDIEGIDFPDINDFTIKKQDTGWLIEANYEETAPLFFNLSLLLHFDKRSDLK